MANQAWILLVLLVGAPTEPEPASEAPPAEEKKEAEPAPSEPEASGGGAESAPEPTPPE